MCNKMSGTIPKYDAVDSYSQQLITDHSLTGATNNQSEVDMLDRDERVEQDNMCVKVKIERDMDFNESSLKDDIIGDNNSTTDNIFSDNNIMNDGIICGTNSMSNDENGDLDKKTEVKSDHVNVTNSKQQLTDHILRDAADSQSETHMVFRDLIEEQDNCFVKVEQERDMDIDKNSTNDDTMYDTNSKSAKIVDDTNSLNDDIICDISIMNNDYKDDTDMPTGVKIEMETLSSLEPTPGNAGAKVVHMEGVNMKALEHPTLASLLNTPSMAEQNKFVMTLTAQPVQLVTSSACSETTKAGVYCEICETMFSNQTNFKIHESQCRWECKLCKNVFMFYHYKSKDRVYLYLVFKEKVDKHKKECDRTCKLCGQSFIVPSRLAKHMKTRHSTDQKYSCDDNDKDNDLYKKTGVESDAVNVTNSKQQLTDHILTNSANSQSETDMLPGESIEEQDNGFIKVKQERDIDVDEISTKDDRMYDTNSKSDKIVDDTSSLNDDIICDISIMNYDYKGDFDMQTGVKIEMEDFSSVEPTPGIAVAKVTHMEGVNMKALEHRTLTSLLATPKLAEQNTLVMNLTAQPVQPVTSSTCSETTKIGVYCEICETMFSNQSNFKNHEEKCRWVCKLCKKAFVFYHYKANNRVYLYSVFKEKVDKHKKECDRTCKLCGRSFVELHNLARHMKTRHSTERQHSCDVCFFTFDTESSLYKHKVTTHTGENGIYRCPLCSNEYPLLQDILAHLRHVHLAKKKYATACSLCGKMCTGVAIKRHERSHRIRDIKCDQCPAVFKSRIQLKDHQRRHNKDYSHICDICGKGFLSIATLQTHLRIHTGEKPYSCSLCEYTCNVKGNLEKHMDMHYKPLRGNQN